MPPKFSSKRNLRALEVLDKHISKRSSKNNEQSSNSLPWSNNQTSPAIIENSNNSSNPNNLKIKINPKNQHNINNQSFNNNSSNCNSYESPTPKRRKTVTQNNIISRQLFNQNNLAETEDEDNNNLNSSPIKKTVSFSDHIEIESSPLKNSFYFNGLPTRVPQYQQDFESTIASSPRISKSPPKSILKKKNEINISKNASMISNNNNHNRKKNKGTSDVSLNNNPSQFIINNKNILNRTNKDSAIDNANLPTTTTASTNIDDPFQLEYWTSGEIHSLSDSRNLIEFKNIIIGGLFILEHDSYPYNEKRFEIYATFNNIIPIITMKNINDVNEKKINILIENFIKIIKICIPQWNLTQKKLLKNDITTNSNNILTGQNSKGKNLKKNRARKMDKENDNVIKDDKSHDNKNDNDNPKDPFVSRLYYQIVKFFTILLSNFKIVKWLSNNNDMQSEIKIIYQYSLNALTDIKSNKPILISNLTFLKEEKFYTYYATRPEIVNLIHAIPNIKAINSQNYMLEKVYYVKSLLNKFPNLMIKHMDIWLCSDLLPQIIIEYDTYSEKLSIISISLLLDLLKKIYDTSNISIKELYSTIVNTSVKNVFSPQYFKKLQQSYTNIMSIPKDVNIDAVTLETLLFHHIVYLLQTKKSYKIAIDLWLTLVGILFSNTTMIQTFINICIKNNKWLTLNKLAFESESDHAKLLALKSWRILIYPICMNMHKFSSEERVKCYKILDIPFSMSQHAVFLQNISAGVSFITRAIIYTIACYFYSSKLSIDSAKPLFCNIWNELIIPMFERVLSFKSTNNELQKLICDIFIRLLGGTVIAKQLSSNYKDKLSNPQQVVPIKVIATVGIHLNEIPSLPTNLENVWYPIVKDFTTKLIKEYGKEIDCLALLYALINATPEAQIKLSTFIELTELVSFYLKNLCHLPLNSTDIFSTLSPTLFMKFSSLIFTEEDDHLANYFGHFKMIKFDGTDIVVSLLKDIIKSMRNQLPELLIFYKFLDFPDEYCHKYIVNWLSSTLLSPTMDFRSFKVLIDFIKTIPETSIIDNFLTIFPRMEQPYFDIFFSKCISWPPNSLQCFINGCLSTNDSKLLNFTIDLIKEVSPFQHSLFINTLPILYEKGMSTFIQVYTLDHPDILETMEPSFYPYVNKDSQQSLLPFLTQHISMISNEKKIYILDRLLKEEGLVSVINKSELFFSILFNSSSDFSQDDQKKMILKLLNKAYEEMNWDVFSIVIEHTLHFTNINYVEMFFSNHNAKVYEIMNYFPINLIVNLCSSGGKIDGLIDQAISQMFKNKDADFRISLIRAFLNLKKYNDLNKFIDVIVFFLFDDTTRLSEIQKNKKLKLFRDILTKIRSDDGDILVNILNSVVSYFPFIKSDFKIELLESIPKSLGKESDKSCYFNQIAKINLELERLHKTNLEISKNSKKNKIGITSSSKEYLQNTINQENDEAEIQVPATQKIDIVRHDIVNEVMPTALTSISSVENKIITSSNCMSSNEATNLVKRKNNFTSKRSIEKQAQLKVATSTQINLTRCSIQSLLDSENIDNKDKNTEEVILSFPEDVNNKENKFVGNNDNSSTIEEVERLSHINKTKIEPTQDINPGIGIHKIFDTSKNEKLLKGLTIKTGHSKFLSSPVSKEDDLKNASNSLIFSSPVRRISEKLSPELEGLSQHLDVICTADKRTKVNKIVDDNKTFLINKLSSFVSNLLTEKNNLSAPQSYSINDGNIDVNMEINNIHTIISDVHENITLQEKDVSNIIQNHVCLDNTEDKQGENLEAVEMHSSLDDNRVAAGLNIHNNTEISNNDLFCQSNKESEQINNHESQPLSIDNINIDKSLNVTNKFVNKEVKDKEKHKETENESTERISTITKEDTVKDTKEEETNIIRIPIFNSLKLHDRQTNQETMNINNMKVREPAQTGVLQAIPENQNHLVLNIKNGNGNNITVIGDNKNSQNKTTKYKEQIEDEDFLQDSYIINSEEDYQKESDNVGINGNSREAIPSLKNHFPSKKTRKLVSRLHNFSAADLAAISIAERRNLRVELLDFMMKLEYYNTDEI